MKRRDFLRQGTLGVAAVAATPAAAAGSESKRPESLEYRTLGRTGLKVSTISLTAKHITHSALLFRAFDLGLRYVDTSPTYGGGNNERLVGELLRDHRDEMYVATKAPYTCRTVKDVEESLHASLKALGTDYIDVYQVHRVHTIAQVHNEEYKAFLSKAKEEGKIRFVGVTTHTNMPEIVAAAAEDGFYDTVLTVYNFKHADNKPLTEAIEKAHKAGVGVIAMKTQQGGYKVGEGEKGAPHQAALRWVLSNPAVTCAIPGVSSYEMLEENVSVMGTKLSAADLQDLRRYADATASVLCRLCGECTKTCRQQIEICESLRCLMYAEGYNDLRLAREEYAGLQPFERADACRLCSDCSARCVKGLRIQERMLTADRILA